MLKAAVRNSSATWITKEPSLFFFFYAYDNIAIQGKFRIHTVVKAGFGMVALVTFEAARGISRVESALPKHTAAFRNEVG